MKKLLVISFTLVSTITLTGCINPASPNVYDVRQAGVASQVEPGTIMSKRSVKIDAKGGFGGLAGIAAGGIGGSAIGGGSRANLLGGVGGAVLGGLIGNAIDTKVNRFPAYEYIIKLKNGNSISVAQSTELEFQVHQPVLVIYGPTTRIVPHNA